MINVRERRDCLSRQLAHLRRQSFSGSLHILMEEEENLEDEREKGMDTELNEPSRSALELYYLNL